MGKGATQVSIIIYSTPNRGVEVYLRKETLCLAKKMIADVFDTSADDIGLHLVNRSNKS